MNIVDLRRLDKHVKGDIYISADGSIGLNHVIKQPKDHTFRSGDTRVNKDPNQSAYYQEFSLSPEGKLVIQKPIKQNGIITQQNEEYDLPYKKDELLHIGRIATLPSKTLVFGFLTKSGENSATLHIHKLENNELKPRFKKHIKNIDTIYQLDWGTLIKQKDSNEHIILFKNGFTTSSEKLSPPVTYTRFAGKLVIPEHKKIIAGGEGGYDNPALITEDTNDGSHYIEKINISKYSGNRPLNITSLKLDEPEESKKLAKPIQVMGANIETEKVRYYLILREDNSVDKKAFENNGYSSVTKRKITTNINYLQPLSNLSFAGFGKNKAIYSFKDFYKEYRRPNRIDCEDEYGHYDDLEAATPVFETKQNLISLLPLYTQSPDQIGTAYTQSHSVLGIDKNGNTIPVFRFMTRGIRIQTKAISSELHQISKTQILNLGKETLNAYLKQSCV